MIDLRDALTDLADQQTGRVQRDLVASAWRTARRRRQRRVMAGAAGAVAVVAGLAAGLGLESGGGPASSPPVASAPRSIAPPPPSPSSQSFGQTTRSTRGDGRITFASPSGNITCAMDRREVVCDVAQQSWSLSPADVASCGHAALAGISLPVAKKPRFDCRTDVLVPHPQQVLAYGESIAVGHLTCSSATTGVRCQDRRTGHRFFVSRQTYRMA